MSLYVIGSKIAFSPVSWTVFLYNAQSHISGRELKQNDAMWFIVRPETQSFWSLLYCSKVNFPGPYCHWRSKCRHVGPCAQDQQTHQCLNILLVQSRHAIRLIINVVTHYYTIRSPSITSILLYQWNNACFEASGSDFHVVIYVNNK